MTGFVVRPTVEDDWREVRDLRMEMLADTPLAYLETLEQGRAHPESHWRERAAGTGPTKTCVAAVADDGRWLGTMTGLLTGAGPTLVGVYVAPDARGRAAGVTDALLTAVEDWARRHGDALTLEVHEGNPRAIAAYESRGFRFTGARRPYPLDPSSSELEMRKPL